MYVLEIECASFLFIEVKFMSFTCGNFNSEKNRCNKLKSKCLPGKKGCVLEGIVNMYDISLDDKRNEKKKY